MPKRFCLECRQLYDRDATGTMRCAPCQARTDGRVRARRNARPRGRTVARGYGQAHRDERERWAPVVAAGAASCTQPVCLERTRAIAPGAPWDLAHNRDRSGWLGPAHARCNRAAGDR